MSDNETNEFLLKRISDAWSHLRCLVTWPRKGSNGIVIARPRPIQKHPDATLLSILAALILSVPSQAPVSALSVQDATAATPRSPEAVVIYLVRHAEKAIDPTDDPPLALAGQIRVQVLRHLLAESDLKYIHTTDWKRTRETARPIARDMGVEPSIYDAGDLAAFAATLKATPGHHLVVGHSNTTPMLVETLGGDPSTPFHDLEYDRLYIVVIPPGLPPVTTILRFGEPYVEGEDFGLRAEWRRRPREPSRPPPL